MSAKSLLFVPGDRPDRFEKALNAGADAIILDLEDAVTAGKKAEAREAIAAWLSPERPVYVRINDPATELYEDDLESAVRPGLAGIMVPKAEDPAQLAQLASRIGEIRMIPTIETALGVWNVRAVAEVPGVERLAFGPVDLQFDAGITGEGTELLYARSRTVLASRVAGILPPLDGVTVALDDPAQLEADVDRARRLGFGGKICIHPKQVEAVNRGFSPSEEEVAWAERVLREAETTTSGAIQVDGELIDRPVIERARAVLARI